MLSDATMPGPRCVDCHTVLVHAGAICFACDVETHFEAPIRTAPPIDAASRREAEGQASLLERSRVDTQFPQRRRSA